MGKKIYINPGHSDKDPGAVGYETERRLNVKVSGFMNEYLLANYECETRMNPGSVNSVSAVAADANKWGADLIVSNHFNAGGGDGYEALVYSSKNVPLGRVFEKHVVAIGQNSRGVKIRPDLCVLRDTNMPAVLNEGAFVDNYKDIQDWNEDAELKKMGIAYAKAAAEAMALPKKAVAESTELYRIRKSWADAASQIGAYKSLDGAKSACKDGYTVYDSKGNAVYSKAGYTLNQFIREVQAATGATVDGSAGPETLSKTVTVSRYKNSTHKVVKPIQKRLAALGYTEVGAADGSAGPKFEKALKSFQKDNGCTQDGEATARQKTWKKLLGMA